MGLTIEQMREIVEGAPSNIASHFCAGEYFERWSKYDWCRYVGDELVSCERPIDAINLADLCAAIASHDAGVNTTTASPRHDLPQDGAKVHDGEKEAVKSSRGAFNIWRKSKVDGYDAWDAWQHQQAVVATLTEALDIKEQLNQKLREREEELQKRVGAVESTLRAMREKAAAKYQVSFVEEDGGADYWSGQFNAFDAALHSLGFKDSHDEGADHESN